MALWHVISATLSYVCLSLLQQALTCKPNPLDVHCGRFGLMTCSQWLDAVSESTRLAVSMLCFPVNDSPHPVTKGPNLQFTDPCALHRLLNT